jgi:hypothetical protein
MRLNISVLDNILPLLTYHRLLKFNLPCFDKFLQPDRRELEDVSYGHVVVAGTLFLRIMTTT